MDSGDRPGLLGRVVGVVIDGDHLDSGGLQGADVVERRRVRDDAYDAAGLLPAENLVHDRPRPLAAPEHHHVVPGHRVEPQAQVDRENLEDGENAGRRRHGREPSGNLVDGRPGVPLKH